MNSNLIRERLNRDTSHFVFRLSDRTRMPVAHPNFVAVSPGQIAIINPLHVGRLKKAPAGKLKSNGKGSH
jgi:hypothetical protein